MEKELSRTLVESSELKNDPRMKILIDAVLKKTKTPEDVKHTLRILCNEKFGDTDSIEDCFETNYFILKVF